MNSNAAKMWSLMVAMDSIVMSTVNVFPRHTEATVLIKKAIAQIDCPCLLESNNLPRLRGPRPGWSDSFYLQA